MSDLSLYNLGAVTDFTREWSSYPPSEDAPFLPEGLVGYNCCLTYFRNYDVSKYGFAVDPGLPRNQRAISLDDGTFEPCGSYNPQGGWWGPRRESNSRARQEFDYSSVLVYPGCTVTYTVSGKYYYFVPRNSVSQSTSTSLNLYGDLRNVGYIEISCSVREGLSHYVKLDANGDPIPATFDPETGRPTSYEVSPFSTCCPVTAAIAEQSTFTFANGDGLNWNNMVTRSPFTEPTYNESCQRSQWQANNVADAIWGYGDGFYPSCLNFTSNSVPNVDYDLYPGERLLTYNLLATFGNTDSRYCCQGQLRESPIFYPGTYYTCVEEIDCATPCRQLIEPTEPEGSCQCVYPAWIDPCNEYKNVYLQFTYQNKSNCVAEIFLDDDFWILGDIEQCTGSDIKIEVQVVSGPPGCTNS